MRLLALLCLFGATELMGQPGIVETVAYSRNTTPGIPSAHGIAPGANNPFPVKYFIYVTIKKGTPVSSVNVCLKGKSYSAKLERVSPPVVVPHDANVRTNVKDTLVPKTADDVYQVTLGEPTGSACEERFKALAQDHDLVVCLKTDKALVYGTAKTIVPLSPAAGM